MPATGQPSNSPKIDTRAIGGRKVGFRTCMWVCTYLPYLPAHHRKIYFGRLEVNAFIMKLVVGTHNFNASNL